MPTVAELKTTADALGLAYKAKTTKPELETLINGKLAELAAKSNANFLNAARTISPLSSSARELHYRSAAQGGSNLTAKQAKRLRKKENKNG